MGLMKRLSLQLLLPSHCFHLPVLPTPTSPSAVRLIATDGSVEVFDSPVAAEELYRQHPFHLICRSDSFFIGQKVPALAASEHLQPGHSYFILPSHFFHNVLSFVTLSSSLIKNSTGAAGLLRRGFEIRKTDKGVLQVRVREELTEEEEEEVEEEERRPRVCDSEELEKEYRQLCRGRPWKPSLETITELSTSTTSTGANKTSSIFSTSRKGMLLLLLLLRRRRRKHGVGNGN